MTMEIKKMSTFSERESLEDIAWTAFEKWLDKGHWNYKRFKYPKDITNIDFSGYEASLQRKLKSAMKEIDFDHDGMMHRGPDCYLFDLKYKSKMGYLGVVNVDSYDAYWDLHRILDMSFIVVFYIRSTNKLFFHPVENPEPFNKEDWHPWVYRVPLDRIVEIDTSLKWDDPRSLIEYYIETRTLEGHKTTKEDVIKEMSERVHVKPWIGKVPLAKIRQVDLARKWFMQSIKKWLSE